MCLAIDVLTQKFGFQISQHQTGLTNEQKSLNGFEPTVYYPTNWRNSQYQRLLSKFPQFIRYGGLVPVNPEWFQKNYQGTYSIKEQPVVNEPEAFTVPRYS